MVEVTDGGSVDMENTIGGEISVPIGHPVETDDRQFTVKNIKQPGGWRTNPDLQRVFDQSESFEISFSKPDSLQKLKLGSIFFLFSTVKEAQAAYIQLSGSKLDGEVLDIEISEKFVIPGSNNFFKISSDQTVRARTIYALNLATADRGPLEGILGQDAIESVRFMSQEGDKQQAEILMSSEDEAKSARQDANIFEDEDPSSSMKLLTAEEYERHVKEARSRARKTEAPRPKTDFKQNDKENKPIAMAPEVEEEDIINALNQQVEEEKLNWAELTEVEELYSICDKASEKFNGLPDSILKPAMLSTLNRHFQETESHWLREHLMTLIGVWRREVESEVPYIRETQVVMKAPEYQPVLVNKSRKRKAKDTRAGKIMMGVGALLQSTRVSMRTENGEVEIDEDDGGNIMLNGEMLSFDSWAKATRTNQPEIVVAEGPKPQVQAVGQEQANGKQRKPKPQREFMDFADYKKYKKEQYEKRMGNKKMKIMNQHRKEMAELEALENKSTEPEGEVKAVPEVKPPKELDEGEIDSEEERQMEKKKKKAKKASDSSSSSSSSEGSDDDDGPSNARGRRAQMRKLKQKKMANNPTSNPIMTNIFDFRHQITKHLPLDQKKQLVHQLREVLQSHGSLTTEQNSMYMKFSDDVTRLSH